MKLYPLLAFLISLGYTQPSIESNNAIGISNRVDSALDSSGLETPLESKIESARSLNNEQPMATKKPRILGDLLHPYASFGFISSAPNATQATQSMSKEGPNCPNGLCQGDSTSARYEGMFEGGYGLELGAEYFFDKLHISGMRVFIGVDMLRGSLGSKIANSDERDSSTNNLQAAYERCRSLITSPLDAATQCGILIIAPGSTSFDDTFTFQKTPDAPTDLPNNGMYQSFVLGVDGLLNIPIDRFLRRVLYLGEGFFAKRIGYVKLGAFVGGGVELALFQQGDPNNKTWRNEAACAGRASNCDDAFFAAGGGGFLRYGVSAYLTRFMRVSVGFKKTFYAISSQRWYGFDGARYSASAPDNVGAVRENDPLSQTLLRQKFITSKQEQFADELFITIAIGF